MAFDLASAQPVDDSTPSSGGGFDLASAKPVKAAAPAVPASPGPAHEKSNGFMDAVSGIWDAYTALPKAALSMGTGMVAKPVSDIAGLAALGKEGVVGGGGDPEKFKEYVQDALTYMPKDKAARLMASYNPLALIGKGVGKAGELAGDVVGGKDPGPLRSAAANFTKEAVPQAVGLLGAKVPDLAAGRLAKQTAAADAANKLNAPHINAVQKAQQAGLKMPPSFAAPGGMNSVLEGVSGKIKTAQKISEKNAPKIVEIAQKKLGLPTDEPITVQSLQDLRSREGAHYEAIKEVTQPVLSDSQYLKDIANLKGGFSEASKKFPDLFKNEGIDKIVDSLNTSRMSTTEAVEVIKKLRFDGNTLLKARDNPQSLAQGMVARHAADAIEGLLERKLPKMTGNSDLVNNFRAARKKIAMSYDVEAALNEPTGTLNADILGRLRDKKPMSGSLADIADFYKAFKPGAQRVQNIGSQPAISPLDLGVSMLRASHGDASVWPKLWEIASTLGTRPLARSIITSDWYQKGLDPRAKPGRMTRAASSPASIAASIAAAQSGVDQNDGLIPPPPK